VAGHVRHTKTLISDNAFEKGFLWTSSPPGTEGAAREPHPTVEYEDFIAPQIQGHVTKFAPHQAQKSIA